MSVEPEGMPFLHTPPDPEPRRLLPPFALFWRGLALVGVALVLGGSALRLARASVLLSPMALVLVSMALVSGWAGAIHLTGGQKFDDHPWV